VGVKHGVIGDGGKD